MNYKKINIFWSMGLFFASTVFGADNRQAQIDYEFEICTTAVPDVVTMSTVSSHRRMISNGQVMRETAIRCSCAALGVGSAGKLASYAIAAESTSGCGAAKIGIVAGSSVGAAAGLVLGAYCCAAGCSRGTLKCCNTSPEEQASAHLLRNQTEARFWPKCVVQALWWCDECGKPSPDQREWWWKR